MDLNNESEELFMSNEVFAVKGESIGYDEVAVPNDEPKKHPNKIILEKLDNIEGKIDRLVEAFLSIKY